MTWFCIGLIVGSAALAIWKTWRYEDASLNVATGLTALIVLAFGTWTGWAP